MKVSDHEIGYLSEFIERMSSGLYTPAFETMRTELLALRKVADAAVAFMDVFNTIDCLQDLPDSVEYADISEALKEAGR